MVSAVNTLDVRTRAAWRAWLAKHHATVPEVWLVFHKTHTGTRSMDYEAAVEEAICYGWVDSLIKRLDGNRYARKFTPRKADSAWSPSNRRRFARLEAAGRLAAPGVNRAPSSRINPFRAVRHPSNREGDSDGANQRSEIVTSLFFVRRWAFSVER